MNILICAGGTGGHIFPALALAKRLEERGHRIIWLGVIGGMESRIVPDHGFELIVIDIQAFRGKAFIDKLMIPFKVIRSVFLLKPVFKRHSVDCVVCFGGYPSFVGGLVAKLPFGRKTKLIVHEQNTVMGLSNRILAKVADKVLFAFDSVDLRKAVKDLVVIGNPLRSEILQIPRPEERLRDLEVFRILILGGSLGAAIFNEVIPEFVVLRSRDASSIDMEIVHQCGKGKLRDTLENYAKVGLSINSENKIEIGERVRVEIREFIEDMSCEYARANLAICRSGALTVSEIAQVGLASILVPFPFAVDDHQTSNARVLADINASILINQKDFNPNDLDRIISNLSISDCDQMAVLAHTISRPDCLDLFVKHCEH